MFTQREVKRRIADSGIDELTEVDFIGSGKILRLFLISLHDITVAHMDIGTLDGNSKKEGETRALYQSAIEEMKKVSDNDGLTLKYYFLSGNERMIWFGENILPTILGGDVEKE